MSVAQPNDVRVASSNCAYRAIHESAIVIDTHADTFGRVLDEHLGFLDQEVGLAVNLPAMIKGGLDAQVFALYVEPTALPGVGLKRLLAMAGTFFEAVTASGGSFVVARTAWEVRRAVASGRKCGLLAVEGGHVIESDLNVLRALHHLGVISLTLTHANTNDWADSSQGERRWGGLNDMGRQVVLEMNRLGMLVDVSHVSDETLECVLETSQAPVIASHSCCRSLCNHPRNLSDELIKKIASRGGLVDMAYYPPFLDQTVADLWQRNWTELNGDEVVSGKSGEPDGRIGKLYSQCSEGLPEVGLDRLVEHIDHAVSLVGPEHVGLGSDWDGSTINVKELESCETLPLLTDKLLTQGYSERAIRLILGENFLRVLNDVTHEREADEAG
jgi:membrane dipeptidase